MLWEEHNGILRPYMRNGRGISAQKFGYAAVEASNRRRAPLAVTRSEDDELPTAGRRKLIATSRDLLRNFSIAGWAVRQHLNYVATVSFQSRTGDTDFDRRLEDLFLWWSAPERCDIAGRHSLQSLLWLAETARVVDGDILILRTISGQLQLIEADRIFSPKVEGEKGRNIVGGVEVDEYGRALRYAVHRRLPGGGFAFEKWVDADNAKLLGYYDRVDQVRGVSRLASVVNTLVDLYEGIDYAVAKAKIAQLFGLVTYRDARESGFATEEVGGSDGPRYEVKFGRGPFYLDLLDGDRAEILESKTPPAEFQEFCRQLICIVLKALDIPFSFYDESHTNYSGARQALLQYQQGLAQKREALLQLLDWITVWKISQWISAGILRLPKGVGRITDIAWEWIPMGMPWIDPLREIQADTMAIEAGLRSRSQILRERGGDFFATADQLAVEEEYLRERKDAVSQ